MQLAGQAPSVSRRALIEIAIGAALIVSGVTLTIAAARARARTAAARDVVVS